MRLSFAHPWVLRLGGLVLLAAVCEAIAWGLKALTRLYVVRRDFLCEFTA